MSRFLYAPTVEQTRLNGCSPPLPAAPLQGVWKVWRLHLGVAAAASLERPNKVGGAGQGATNIVPRRDT